MSIQEFSAWLPAAPRQIQALAAAKLGYAYLYGGLPEAERDEARRALTLLACHDSPLVRLALAKTFASAADAPHCIVHALANDRSDVASIVLARSPLLSTAELVDCAATGDSIAQTAIASRPWVGPPVCAALAEAGSLAALLVLAANPGAELLEFSLRRMIERHGQDADLRAAIFSRPNLPITIRLDLACAAAVSRAASLAQTAGLPPGKSELASRDAFLQGVIGVAAGTASNPSEIAKLLAYLRRARQLTAGLLLRCLLCGNKNLFEFALCELTGLRLRRVAGLVASEKSAEFAALYRKAGMPERLLPVFTACLAVLKDFRCSAPAAARLQGRLIEAVLPRCIAANSNGELDPAVTELRRLELEAAGNEARDFCSRARGNNRRPMPPSRPRRATRGSPAKAAI